MKIGPFKLKVKRSHSKLLFRTFASLIVLLLLMGVVIHEGIQAFPLDADEQQLEQRRHTRFPDTGYDDDPGRAPTVTSQGTILRKRQSFAPNPKMYGDDDWEDAETEFPTLEADQATEESRPANPNHVARRPQNSQGDAVGPHGGEGNPVESRDEREGGRRPTAAGNRQAPPSSASSPGIGVLVDTPEVPSAASAPHEAAGDAEEAAPGSSDSPAYCARFKDVRVFRYKGFQQHGTTWGEMLLSSLITAGCKETGSCETTDYTLEGGVEAEFPGCNNTRWTFLSKSKHTNHPGKVKATMLGAVSLLSIRDPRDALVALHQNRLTIQNITLPEFFEETFAKMLQYMTYNIGRVREDGGFLLRYEELHRAPVAELGKASAVFGLKASDELLARVVKQRSHKATGSGRQLTVETPFYRRLEGKNEDVMCGVGEHRLSDEFRDLLPQANRMMKDQLPQDISSYYLSL